MAKINAITGATACLLLLNIVFAKAQNKSANETKDSLRTTLINMSLEELLQVTIKTGSVTGMKKQNAPVSITTITAGEIAQTPARNLLDLLETYVPGALFMNHIEGPHPGMRGIIVDRSYKVLLLVNGKNLNQKTRNGASSELENWDMNDIDRIEIIRGPGSVTYGPGAIMGVINIITKNAATSPGFNAFSQYATKYNSAGAGVSYGLKQDDISFFGYGSITRTPGYSPDAYTVDIASMEAGYVGRDFSGESSRSHPVLRYYSDHHDQPQIKAYMELDFLKDWTIWARYTNSGATVNGTFTQSRPQLGHSIDSINMLPGGEVEYFRSPVYGEYEDIFSMSARQFSAFLENDKHFADFLNLPDGLDLQTTLGYTSFSGVKGFPGYATYDYELNPELKNEYADKTSHWNQTYMFSEDEWFASALANVAFSENYIAAIGAKYAHQTFGPAWGTNILKLQNINPYIIDQDGEPTLDINNGWSTDTYSFLAELNFRFSPYLTLLYSGRADKNSYSPWLISPRIALVSELNAKNVVKLVAQQSRRMNNAEELHSQYKAGAIMDPETLSGVEFMYSRIHRKNFIVNVSGFYNHIGVISWSGTHSTSRPTGDLRVAGIEGEAIYHSDRVNVGINHAFTKQLSWKMLDDVDVTGISYSDYNLPFDDGTVFTGYGNDLNNWANHATKIYGQWVIVKDRLTLHANMRTFWAFEGARDGLDMIERAIEGQDDEAETRELLREVSAKDVYGMDMRFNASAALNVNKNLSLSVFAMNLFTVGNAKRYSYDAGILYKGPARVAFVEEPFSLGVKLKAAL